ncbi:MAG: hypothetical protein OQJ89_08090 [Kangiellaceae bacterium]|nr:hypothetical protein [Kangiellaceae bacterium]MCW8999380.1 hypothetical protein [Kangiellaceae bacterium]MCW9016907.1 hypothetical protein [Kangiellaceae bacterium]
MNQLPFKQSETVSNEYVFALFIIIILLGAGLWALTRLLKSKGLIKIESASSKKIEVTEQKVISHGTKVYLLKVGNKEFLLTESNKNCNLVQVDKSSKLENKLKKLDSFSASENLTEEDSDNEVQSR